MLGLGNNIEAVSAISVAIAKSTGGNFESQNYSLYLDGASDRLQGGNSNGMFQDWTANQDWTLKFSIKLDAQLSYIATVGPTSSYIFISTDSSGHLSVSNLISGTVYTHIWSTGFATGTWYEVVITCDSSGSDKAFNCYVDKVAQTSTTQAAIGSSTSLLPTSGKVFWGTFFGLVDSDFRIDSIASWSIALSSANITELYDSYPDLTEDYKAYTASSRLTSYYKLEEGTGTTTADSSGTSSADLQLINTPTWSSDTRI